MHGTNSPRFARILGTFAYEIRPECIGVTFFRAGSQILVRDDLG